MFLLFSKENDCIANLNALRSKKTLTGTTTKMERDDMQYSEAIARRIETPQESAKIFQEMVERANDGMVIIQDGIIKYINPSLVKLTGFNREELTNSPFTKFLHPESIRKIIEQYKQRMNGKNVPNIYETRLLTNSGDILDVEINATLFTYNNRTADLVIIRDISERHQVEQALHDSEEKYRTILDNLEDGYYEVDRAGNLIFFNESLSKILGYSREEILGMNFKHYVDEKTASIVFQTFNKVYRTGRPTKAFNWEIIRKDQTRKIVEASVSLMVDDNKQARGFRGIVRDITDRKKTEDALKESEQKFRVITERTMTGVCILQDRVIKYANQALADIMEYSIEEMLNWKPDESMKVIHPDDKSFVMEQGRKKQNGDKDVVVNYTYRAVSKSGKIKWVDNYSKPIIFMGRPAALVTLLDITERKQAENTLQETKLKEERYQAMLSHFINNDLQKIVLNLEVLSIKFKLNKILDEQSIQNIANIAHHSSNTIETVNKIYEVFKSPFNPQLLEKNYNPLQVLNETLSELQSSIASSYSITITQETLDLLMLGDLYLKDVFYNILSFVLKDITDKNIIEIEGSLNQSYFFISIRDSCTKPIPKEICYRLSKSITDDWESQGHYLGISLASVIMQHYGGSLTIYPFQQKGNEFILCFPSILIQSQQGKNDFTSH